MLDRQNFYAASVAAVAVAGVAGSIVALGNHNADTQFLDSQLRPASLSAAAVEQVVGKAPDPVTGKGSGTGASCTKGGRGLLGNPWTCVVRYKGGKHSRIRVEVGDDQTYSGRFLDVPGAGATGCCINLPGTR